MGITNILKAMRSGLTPSERFVWQCLENRANGAGFWRMTDKAIAAELDIAVKSVQRAIAALVHKGIITAERHKRRPTVFHVTRANGQTHADLSSQNVHSTPELTSQNVHSTTREAPELSGQIVHTARGLRKKEKKDPTERKKDMPQREKKRAANEGDEAFAAFWKAYPRKVGKRAASKAFALALKRASPTKIMAGLANARWADDPQFIPHPTTWLNGDRWLDEHDHTDPVLRALGITDLPEYDDIFTTPIPKGRLQ